MSITVIKRDGRLVPFDETKITLAISKALKCSPKDLAVLINEITSQITQTKISVEEIQDLVEKALINHNYADAAKAYILYRNERTRRREAHSDLNKTISSLVSSEASDLDLKRENANIDGNAPMGIMLQFGSEVSKKFALENLIEPEQARAHQEGLIHIHDLNLYSVCFNCCQIPAGKLLKQGFSTGHGYIREPNSIQTAAALMCIIIQSNQNSMFGGQAIPLFEYDLAPYVMKSYFKNLEELAQYEGISLDISSLEAYSQDNNTIIDYNPFSFPIEQKIYQEARKLTEKQTYQAMEALIHNLNTMQSRAGAQTPFSSINYGTGTTPEQRLIIKSVLEATDAGMGSGETPIFPVQVFKVLDGTNTKEGDPNYDLFQLACKVSAKRLFPNFVFIGAPYNYQFYKKGHPETEIAVMGCASGESVILVQDPKWNNTWPISLKEFVSLPNWQEYRVWDSSSNVFVKILNIINNPSVENWYRITFSDGRYLTVTSDHYLPVEEKGRVQVKDLVLGDKVLNGTIPSVQSYPLPLDSLREDPSEIAWLYGLVIRDGCYATANPTICVGLDEKELLEKAAAIINNLGYETKIVRRERGIKGNYYELRVLKGKSLTERFIRAFRGINKKERTLSPWFINSVDSAYFLAGMIDADGHIHEHAGTVRVQLGTTNETLSLQTMFLAQSLKLHPKMYVASYGAGANKLRYSCEFEIPSYLANKLQCHKKKEKALQYPSSKINMPKYVEVTKIVPLSTSMKSYCLETETDRFDINGVNSHNCRTRVLPNIYDPEHQTPVGRGNIAFTTMNLPMIALLSEGNLDIFFNKLDKTLKLCYNNLYDRFKYLSKKHAYNYPFLFSEGVWLDSEKLQPEDTIEEVLKQGTLAIGFCGLAECLVALIGKHHGESEEAQQLGLKIVGRIKSFCDQASKNTGLTWGAFASPAESAAGRFARINRKEFGLIEGVTDRDYITNGNHVPVYYPISAANKIEIEAPYHALCSAGDICYVECEGDISKNPKAFESIILYMKDKGICYGSINHPVDRCPVCGYVGIINDICPKCGRHEYEAVSVEKLKSLGCKC